MTFEDIMKIKAFNLPLSPGEGEAGLTGKVSDYKSLFWTDIKAWIKDNKVIATLLVLALCFALLWKFGGK